MRFYPGFIRMVRKTKSFEESHLGSGIWEFLRYQR